MVVLELRFTDDEARLAARPAHRERLARLHAEGRLMAAGPWPDDSGALLLFQADEETVREIMADDPYYATPGVSVVGLRRWQPIVGVASPPPARPTVDPACAPPGGWPGRPYA